MDELTRSLTEDHQRIDRLLARFRLAEDPGRARPLLEEFFGALARHIDWEEQTLFPLFEEKSGSEGAVFVIGMRREHQKISGLLAVLRGAPEQDRATRRSSEEALVEALEAHNRGEEELLYPWIGGELDDGERRDLLARLAR